jgi:hypothetical protein
MNPSIVLVREEGGFRIESGHEDLAARLQQSNEVFADVKLEKGKAKIVRTDTGLLVIKDSRQLPLLQTGF